MKPLALTGLVAAFVGFVVVAVLSAQQTGTLLVPPAFAVATSTASTATSATTLSLAPNIPTDSIYIYEIDIQNCVGASVVTAAAVTTITTTNITGGLAFTVGSGVAAGLCQPLQIFAPPTGLKAQAPGLPVTIVLPAFATNQTLRVNVAYRSAP